MAGRRLGSVTVVAALATAVGGCASADWQLRVADTEANWKGLQMTAKRHGYPITYLRDRELLSSRQVTGNSLHGAWTRVAARRDGEWIHFRTERWGRGGVLFFSWWSFGGQEEEKQKKLFAALSSEPGTTRPEWPQAFKEEGWIPDDPVECPGDAPEYSATEDFYTD